MKPLKIFLPAALSFSLAFCSASRKTPAPDSEHNPQYQYEKAVVAWKYGFPDQALDYLNRALALDPRHVPAYNLLGLISIQNRDFSRAIEVLERSLEIKPDFPEALNRLGTAYYETGQKNKAKEEFQKAFAVDENAFAAFNLAKMGLEEKELAEALSYIDASIGKDGRQAGSYNLKGVILNQMERYPEAIAAFETALTLNPKDVNAVINLGIALMNAGQYDRARKVFDKALPLLEDPALRDKIAEYLKRLKDAG